METQPLLAGGLPAPAGAVLHDHPIFLRACHSPWQWLNQNVLCYVRGLVLAYVMTIAIMTTHFKLEKEDRHSDWRFIFQFSTITWGLVILYHLMVFCWTLTHLHWPEVDANDNTWESKILRLMQPPQQTNFSRRRFYFSLFYSLVHVYSFMITIIYWTVLIPNGHGHLPRHPGDPKTPDHFGDHFWDDLLAEGWFKPFCLFHIYTFPSFLAAFEIFFLNAIRRQVPVPSHVFAIEFLAALYLGWAAIGKLVTGHNPFFWMDEKLAGGREIVAAYCIGFVALAAGCFSFMYGLISMRDAMVERSAESEEPATAAAGRPEGQRRYVQSGRS